MPEDQKSSFSEAVETGASAAHTIRGAIKTGKAISSAAKGAAAGGPYGAVAGAVWAGRKHIGKIIVAVIAPVSYTHLRAHETDSYLVCRLLLEKKKQNKTKTDYNTK